VQGGNELCQVRGFDCRQAVSELKVSIEAEAGLVPALTRLIHPESQVELQDHLTLEDAGIPSEQALAAGVIQLNVQKLKKVVVADELKVAPHEVTDSELTVLCDSMRDDPPDNLVLCGCFRVTDISCLMQLSTISHLDISSCDLGAEGGFPLAGVIKDMGALTSLHVGNSSIPEKEMREIMAIAMQINSMKILCEVPFKDKTLTALDVSGKNLGMEGALVVAEYLDGNGTLLFLDISSNGLWENWSFSTGEWWVNGEYPPGYPNGGCKEKPGETNQGFLTMCDAIKNMRALTSLNLSSNGLEAEGAEIVAEAIKVTVLLRSFWHRFHAHLITG
jgi:hypothetical protein